MRRAYRDGGSGAFCPDPPAKTEIDNTEQVLDQVGGVETSHETLLPCCQNRFFPYCWLPVLAEKAPAFGEQPFGINNLSG
jgi:hypothetical protein